MELLVAFMLMGIALAMFVPNGRRTKDVASCRTVAEELVARLRSARQTAITKGVPVAVAFPRTPSILHSDEGFQLEGEVSPQVSERWKIQQPDPRVVYFTGRWSGPTWDVAPVMTTSYQDFDPTPSVWFGPATPPEAAMYVFTPSGNAVSNEQAADGRFRIAIGMGLDTGPNLAAINSPFTVWIDPSGEVGFDVGLYKASGVATTQKVESYPIASFVDTGAVANVPPVLLPIAPSTGAMSYPDNKNPKTDNGNVVDLNSVLTLEVRVADANGDPPYFQWKVTQVGEVNAIGTAWTPQSNMVEWGGRFGNQSQVRMEWDAEKREWVGRDTWTPSTRDKGGNQYVLVCDITDRKSQPIQARFPVLPGTFLVTTKEPWVLYKTWNAAGVVELWKMTLDGLLHTPLVQFGYQNVDFGQWSPSGNEVIVGAADGVYRVTANGENLTKVSSVVLPGGIDGCCISPQGDAVFYLGGAPQNKHIRKVYLDGSGNQADVSLDPLKPLVDNGPFGPPDDDWRSVEEIFDLSGAYFGPPPGKVVLVHTLHMHQKKKWKFFGKWKTQEKRRYGTMAIDAGTGAHTDWEATLSGTHKGGPPGPQGDGSMGFGQKDETPYGVSLFRTDIDLGGGRMETHILYGDAAGNINIRKVDAAFTSSTNVENFRAGTVIYSKKTPLMDTHHPKYGHPDRSSLIFAAGRGPASKIYYMPDINNLSSVRLVPLKPPPANNGAEAPSVSRPR